MNVFYVSFFLQFYAMKFFLCEFLNLINIVGQIYFMDFFLGGEFTKYGTDVLAMTEKAPEEREDPMARVFPKVTKCTFHKFGPSGTVEVRMGFFICYECFCFLSTHLTKGRSFSLP